MTLRKQILDIQNVLIKEGIESYNSELTDTLDYSTSSLEMNYKLKGILESILDRELIPDTLLSKIRFTIKKLDDSLGK
jgi:hypothetical protein